MKRLVWLLLLAFGTVLAHVSPVEVPLAKMQACSCCKVPGACGMPECIPLPAAVQPVFDLPTQTRVAGQSVAKALPAPRGLAEKFYVQFLPRPVVTPSWRVARAVAPPASVPLFEEHCSWLI